MDSKSLILFEIQQRDILVSFKQLCDEGILWDEIQSFLLIVLLQIRFISSVYTLVSQSLSGMFVVSTSGVFDSYGT